MKKKLDVYAEVVQDSISEDGIRITTFNLCYGLIIHAEMCRHREQSRSVRSNRAIPTKVIRSEVLQDPYIPVFFGQNKSGMVSVTKCGWWAEKLWKTARYPVCGIHWLAEKLGAHKEWANRLLFPWQWVRETVTATGFDNFYNLRLHSDAQRDIQAIAQKMFTSQQSSEPMVLKAGQYHVPYVDRQQIGEDVLYRVEGSYVDVSVAVMCSAARVARSSYDNHDKSHATLKADLLLYASLIESKPSHASPVEAQATPMQPTLLDENNQKFVNMRCSIGTFEKGITHYHLKHGKCSGNLVGWIQARQLLDNHTCYDYEKEKNSA